MNKRIFICLLAALFSLAFSSRVFAEAYRHQATGLVFPEWLAHMKKSEVRDYGKNNPDLGVSVGYNLPGIALTIFVYDYGLKEFPAGPNDPLMKRHFDQVVGDVITMGGRGKYENLILEKISDEIVIGRFSDGPKALSASFSYELNGEKNISELYLISYKKHFVKIRYTYVETVERQARQVLKILLDQLAFMLRK